MEPNRWTWDELSKDRHLSEFEEGYRAFYDGKDQHHNPYPHSNSEWWRNEAWSKGWHQAQLDDDD